jgi:hypothetical protein
MRGQNDAIDPMATFRKDGLRAWSSNRITALPADLSYTRLLAQAISRLWRLMVLLLNEIGCTLCYGDDGRVGISADHARHDGCVDHPEPLHAEDPEFRVNHPTDRTSARRVIKGLCMAFDEGPNVRVPAGCRHEMRPPAHRGKSGSLRNVHRELNAADHAPPIFFGCQVVGENPWLDIRPRATELDGSAAGWF